MGSYTTRNRARLICGGGEYFDRMQALIDGACRSIHLHVYIFADDRTGARIGDALVRAAQRGVEVFLLVDGYGSSGIRGELVVALQHAGARVARFEPLFRSRHFYIGRRSHHKVMVVDGRTGMVGGRNIADKYAELDGIPAWYDLALEVEGEVVQDLAHLCCSIWNSAVPRRRRIDTTARTGNGPWWAGMDLLLDARCSIRVRFNDWLYGRTEVTRSYAELFAGARSEIVLMSSYFLPGRVMQRSIARALRRGVRVIVITGGRSDIRLAKAAERWLYAWLLRCGAEVYEYDPTVLHAKVAVGDGEWATLGSFNINELSAYTTLEVNLDVKDGDFVGRLRQELDRIAVHDCRRITMSDERCAGLFERLSRWLAYQALHLLNRVVTFYYRQEA